MRKHRYAATALSLLLAVSLTIGLFPMEARAASSAEIQKAAEGRREHQSVVVAAEVGALAALAVAVDVLQP